MKTAHSENIGRFVSGSVKTLQLGKRGSKVVVKVDSGSQTVVIYRRSGGRKQHMVGPNSMNTRRKAVDAARLVVARLQNARIPHNDVPARAGAQGAAHPPLTVADVWQEYLQTAVPGIPAHALRNWNRKEAAPFIAECVESGRSPMSVDSLVTVLQSARRLHASGTFPFEKEIDKIVPNHVKRISKARLSKYARSSVLTDLRRMRTAIRAVSIGDPDRWAERRNPLALMPSLRNRSAGSEPSQISDRMARLVIDDLKDRGAWRAWSTCEILFHSGRRIGAVAGARKGLHIWGPPLTERDLLRDENGRITHIVWRPEPSKGGGAMNKSEKPPEPQVLPVAKGFAGILEETVSNHPNPLGPSHPLIWSPRDPRRAATYAALSKALRSAWERVVTRIGKEQGSDAAEDARRSTGLAFHGFCRNVITTLVREQGLAEAALFTGRTKGTVIKYLRPADDSVNESADILDRR